MLKRKPIFLKVLLLAFFILFVTYMLPFPLQEREIEEYNNYSKDAEETKDTKDTDYKRDTEDTKYIEDTEDTDDSTPLKTFAELEQSFCLSEITQVYSKSQLKPCPRNGIVTTMQRGRLGNQMWKYASVWALARHTGLAPYVPRCLRFRLNQVFESLSVPTLEEIAHCPVNISAFANDISAWSYTNQSILISPFNFEHKSVLFLTKDIVQEFTFKQEFLDESQSVLRSAVWQLQKVSPVFVGVHVRRTDYIEYLSWSQKHPVNSTFFLNAMQYFEKKFENVQFVFVSDDPGWCREQFAMIDNVYIASNDWNVPALDLAILAACNHTIFDYGTFGQWGAILAGGETIYYNTQNNRHFDFMKNWHSI